MGYVTLTAAQQAALLEVLPNNGDSVELSVGVGETMARAGVTFNCASMHPCTVTVSNSAGTIVAMWSSYIDAGGTADVVAMGHEPPPVTDPLAELNVGNADTLGDIMRNGLNVAADPDGVDDKFYNEPETLQIDESADNLPQRGAYAAEHNVLGGLGLGGIGEMNIKGVTLKSSLNPNADVYVPPSDSTPASGGSTVMAWRRDANGKRERDEDGNPIYLDYNPDAPNATVAAGEGWNHKVLFRDWGDTAAIDDDGGFETAVLLYSNMEAPTENVLFNHDLVDEFVTANAKMWFALTADYADGDSTTSVVGDAVAILVSDTANDQTENIKFTVGAPQLETLADTVEDNSEHRGTYFGAMGTFKCIEDTRGCGIGRTKGGATPFGVALSDSGQTTRWLFKPAPDATIDVPDQDWLVYGAWLTTPDAMSGTHRVGVFFNGMDEYANAATTNVFEATNANGLRGSATYSGGAAGVYVDGEESGMFTARASLTANFDLASNGTNTPDTEPADVGDYMLSGRIYKFKRTDGTYLGTDTEDMPNDPNAGGDNDWVVMLRSAALDADVATSGTVMGLTAGAADGVNWFGSWNGQLYGPDNVTPDSEYPTGVAGDFRARSGSKGVVGAFGATKD